MSKSISKLVKRTDFIQLIELNENELLENELIPKNILKEIQIFREISLAYNNLKNNGELLNSTSKALEHCKRLYNINSIEKMYIIFLSSGNKVISTEMVGQGVVNECYIPLRKVVELVIKYNAVNIIITHNHPGGTLTPSNADLALTKNIKDCLKSFNTRLLDHIICNNVEAISLMEKGYI